MVVNCEGESGAPSTREAFFIADEDLLLPFFATVALGDFRGMARLAEPKAFLDSKTFNRVVSILYEASGLEDTFCFPSDFWDQWQRSRTTPRHSLPKDQAYLFVPICRKRHWFAFSVHRREDGSLEVFCVDLLNGVHFDDMQHLSKCLQSIEYGSKTGVPDFRHARVMSPLSNDWDCGLLLLEHAYAFMSDPEQYFLELRSNDPQQFDPVTDRAYILRQVAGAVSISYLSNLCRFYFPFDEYTEFGERSDFIDYISRKSVERISLTRSMTNCPFHTSQQSTDNPLDTRQTYDQ